MSMFPLAISCLTTFNLPWFIDLKFLIPMEYFSLQHHTLHPSPVISTAEGCFCFGSVSSFFLELFLHSSPVPYQAPTNLVSLSFNVISFCLFILFMRFTWRVTFKLVLEKAEEPEIKLPTSGRSLKQQENPEKHIFLLYWLYQNIYMDHHKFQKILKEVGIPDHLTCLLRNLYADQETTVRTWHGTTDWFQMAKGVHQDCILSP